MKTVYIIVVLSVCVLLSASLEYKFLKAECESSDKKTAVTEQCNVSGRFFHLLTIVKRSLDKKLYVMVLSQI